MASFIELKELNKKGDLSRMLVKKFDGERGFIGYRNEDTDLIIIFKSIEETPFADAIEQAIVEHYTGLGYTVEKLRETTRYNFEALISLDDKRRGFIIVVITTHYPITTDGCLRLTTTVWPSS